MGGRIGIMMAMLYPEYLDKLILVDSTPLMSKKVEERFVIGLLYQRIGQLYLETLFAFHRVSINLLGMLNSETAPLF